jgi:hypothetical protein
VTLRYAVKGQAYSLAVDRAVPGYDMHIGFAHELLVQSVDAMCSVDDMEVVGARNVDGAPSKADKSLPPKHRVSQRLSV